MQRDYDEIYKEYRERRAKIEAMGGEKAVEKQHAASKLTARERLGYFFDDGKYTEIGAFVTHRTTAFGLDKKEIPAEGVIAGFGNVNGRLVFAGAEDYTAMAGTVGEHHGKKFSEGIRMAKEKGVPFVGLNDSGGARLQEGMDTLEAYAWLFREQILASGIIPQIAIIMGPCLGGQAYHPIMQDFLIQCKDTGFLGIAGPAFVKTQLGEEISLEKLCGSKAHAVTSGQTHIVAEDDRDALDQARRLLAYLPSNNREAPPRAETDDDPERAEADLDQLVPVDPSAPFDMHDIIERIIDGGEFFEIFKDFARNVIVGFCRFSGRTVGIVASQPNWMGGVIDCNAADKVARFVRFCDLFNIPLVNLHDTPGFLIGSREEHKGILRHGAKMLYHVLQGHGRRSGLELAQRARVHRGRRDRGQRHIRQGNQAVGRPRKNKGRSDSGLPGRVRKPLCGRRARLHRRCDHAPRHPQAYQSFPGFAGGKGRGEAVQEVFEYQFVSRISLRAMAKGGRLIAGGSSRLPEDRRWSVRRLRPRQRPRMLPVSIDRLFRTLLPTENPEEPLSKGGDEIPPPGEAVRQLIPPPPGSGPVQALAGGDKGAEERLHQKKGCNFPCTSI